MPPTAGCSPLNSICPRGQSNQGTQGVEGGVVGPVQSSLSDVSFRGPPSEKLDDIWRTVGSDRALSSRLAQVLTGHGFFGDYYRCFVPSETPWCSWSPVRQSREHIICACPEDEHARHLLREVSPDLALPKLLGHPKGRDTLAKFLKTTSAFTKRSPASAALSTQPGAALNPQPHSQAPSRPRTLTPPRPSLPY